MIIYDLVCDNDHAFEGWFRDAGDFSAQLAGRLVQCPICASHAIRKVPSAVAIATGRAAESSAASKRPQPVSVPPSATQAIAMFREFSKAMMAMTEDVGSAFAETARRMHYEKIPERPIRGQTSDDEYEALEDEGIPVVRVPVFREEDLN